MNPSTLAEAHLSQHWNGNVAVDVVALLESADVDVYESPMPGCDAAVRGLLYRDPATARFRATVRQGLPMSMQRFILAHQLGHVLLKHEGQEHCFTESGATLSQLGSDQEGEANRFALSLVMPRRAFNYALASGKFTTVEALSKLFDVTQVALAARARELGLVA